MFPIENPMNMACYATLMVGFACLVAAAEPAEPRGGNPAKPEENRGGTGQATVTVNLKAGPKPYSTMIFGGFLEHFDRQIRLRRVEPAFLASSRVLRPSSATNPLPEDERLTGDQSLDAINDDAPLRSRLRHYRKIDTVSQAWVLQSWA